MKPFGMKYLYFSKQTMKVKKEQKLGKYKNDILNQWTKKMRMENEEGETDLEDKWDLWDLDALDAEELKEGRAKKSDLMRQWVEYGSGLPKAHDANEGGEDIKISVDANGEKTTSNKIGEGEIPLNQDGTREVQKGPHEKTAEDAATKSTWVAQED